MSRDRIEFADPETFECECCGGRTTRLTRFVTRDGDAFAIYYAAYTDKHPDFIALLAGFGDWSEDAVAISRTAIAFRIWTTDTNYKVGLVDPEDDGWTTDFLGQRLSRADALKSSWKQELFDLSDHIVECDGPIIEFLA